MQKEIERFIAAEPNGNRYIVRCFQEFIKTEMNLLPGSKYFRTTDGIFLKAIDDFSFKILECEPSAIPC